MGKLLTPENIDAAIGEEIGVSDWHTITQEDVNTFADVTRDHQYIHIDEEKAAQTPFGGTIAHGFLTLSMLSYFAENGAGAGFENAKMGVNYGFDKVRFIHPVRVGSRVRARSILMSVEEKSPGQFLLRKGVTVEIEGVEKPALISEWLVMQIV